MMSRSFLFPFPCSGSNYYYSSRSQRRTPATNKINNNEMGMTRNYTASTSKLLTTWRMTFLIFFIPISHAGGLELVRERTYRQQPQGEFQIYTHTSNGDLSKYLSYAFLLRNIKYKKETLLLTCLHLDCVVMYYVYSLSSSLWAWWWQYPTAIYKLEYNGLEK